MGNLDNWIKFFLPLIIMAAPGFVALIHAVITRAQVWRDAGVNKAQWVVLLLFLGVFAAIPYLIAIVPKLRRFKGRATGGPQEPSAGV